MPDFWLCFKYKHYDNRAKDIQRSQESLSIKRHLQLVYPKFSSMLLIVFVTSII